MSTAKAVKERRERPRQKLTGLLPGRMVNMTSERNISCRPIDISENGLGILTAEQMQDGAQLILPLESRFKMRPDTFSQLIQLVAIRLGIQIRVRNLCNEKGALLEVQLIIRQDSRPLPLLADGFQTDPFQKGSRL